MLKLRAFNDVTKRWKWVNSPSIERAQYYSAPVVVHPDSQGYLHFTTLAMGDDLLDLTDPINPVVRESGVYCLTAVAYCAEVATEGSQYRFLISLDDSNEAATAVAYSAPTTEAVPQPQTSLSLTYYVPEGGTIVGGIINLDSEDRLFGFSPCTLQRIS